LLAASGGAALAQSSPSYLSGMTDRTEYESWFAGLTGEYKAGVEYWVNHRSNRPPPNCFANGMPPESDWVRGCQIAQQRFAPLDAKRKLDPDYRLGWNSIQSPEVQAAAREQAAAPAPSRDAFLAPCSQEVALAYQRGMVPSPTVAYQVQESCISRKMQEAYQAAQAAREASLRAQAAREAQEEARRRQQAEADAQRAQLAAEQSPDNKCRQPKFAGGLMDQFNDFDVFKSAGVKSVDIEHLTTVTWDQDNLRVVCHGTFVLSNGGRLTGTLQMKPNVAGDMIVQWKAD
jgi:membrane peptidoglycan carboxypeptidase